MKKIIGVILIVIGIIFLFVEDITFTEQETIVEADEFEIAREEDHTFRAQPIVGVVLIIGGAVMLVYGFQTE